MPLTPRGENRARENADGECGKEGEAGGKRVLAGAFEETWLRCFHHAVRPLEGAESRMLCCGAVGLDAACHWIRRESTLKVVMRQPCVCVG